jgi:ArsR family transcriptional regulator
MKKDLNDEALKLIAASFRILAEPARLRILHTLGMDELNVTQLVAATGLTQTNVSRQLGILLAAGVVSRRREGLTANYRVTDQNIFDICDLVCSRLKTRLDLHRVSLDETF